MLSQEEIGYGARASTSPGFLLFRLKRAYAALLRSGRQMCGIPDYESYLAHQRIHHPDCTPMEYEEFFRQRLDARYGKNGNARCC